MSSRLVCRCAQVQLFAETFTEQLSYIGLLRADSVEAFEAAKQKFITGLTVREIGNQWSYQRQSCQTSLGTHAQGS